MKHRFLFHSLGVKMGIPVVKKLHAASLLFFAVASQLPANAQSEPALSHLSGTERGLVEAARARQQAYAHGECLDWASYVSADFHSIDTWGRSFTRDQEIKECQEGHPQHAVAGSKDERVLTDFHCQINGNLAFLNYRKDEIHQRGDTKHTRSYRHLDIFERHERKWTVIQTMEVQIFDDPPIARIEPASYDAFVGQYESSPGGVVDFISRKGDKLFGADTPDGTGTELFPESSDTFFIPGDPTHMTFVRDETGKVTGLVLHIPDREIVRERKVR
jgi:hypothetical protein